MENSIGLEEMKREEKSETQGWIKGLGLASRVSPWPWDTQRGTFLCPVIGRAGIIGYLWILAPSSPTLKSKSLLLWTLVSWSTKRPGWPGHTWRWEDWRWSSGFTVTMWSRLPLEMLMLWLMPGPGLQSFWLQLAYIEPERPASEQAGGTSSCSQPQTEPAIFFWLPQWRRGLWHQEIQI